jgi:fluoroquinolone transport system ATP-binding protein
MMIEVSHVYHDYEGKGNDAVHDVSFRIEDGEIFGFLGPSGAGKSTVQNIMTKLLSLQKGEILYDGRSIRELKKTFFNSVGYSFEHPNIFNRLTGYENLKYFAGLFSVPTEKPEKLLDMVGLTSSMHKRAGRYSKGMKQRLIFARSLINRPKILFLDEPLSGLDPRTGNVIKEIIRSLRTKGTTIFMTTHNMHAADELCDVVAFINEGRIVACDTPRHLKLEYGEKGVIVEYTRDKKVKTEVLNLTRDTDLKRFTALAKENLIETLHSKEASLEAIFTHLTGRGLTG